MKYTEIVINVPKENLEDLSNTLIINDFESFEVYDYTDLESVTGELFYDYIDDDVLNTKYNDPQIKIYFDSSDEALALISKLEDLLIENKDILHIRFEKNEVESEDWENNWRQYFFPFTVGEHLLVKPSWEEVDDEMAQGRTIIEIDPAGAFGSGTHATTRLCMEALEKCDLSGKKLLDMGCGSGILAICALKIGAGKTVAVDIDEIAADTARDNFIKNNCPEGSFEVLCGDALTDSEFADSIDSDFDIIAANIVAGVIVLLSDFFYKKLKTGGELVASGIIAERTDEVKDALIKSGFIIKEVSISEDWCEITCQK